MTLEDFFFKITQEYKLSEHIADKLIYILLKNTSEDNVSKTPIDDAVFEKIIMMKKHSVPEEFIYNVIKNSLDWFNCLDIRKFWRELGAFSKNLGTTQEEIKQDIKRYEKNSQKYEFVPISLMQALNRLEKMGFNKWEFLANDVFINLVVSPETRNNVVENMVANAKIIDAIARMHKDGWSKADIMRELTKQTDGKAGFNQQKLSHGLPKDLISNQRRISAKDGTFKYRSNISLLKYVNPILKFFTDNIDQISELSKKYKNDNAGFARAFYNLYVTSRGWGENAPELLIDTDKIQQYGGFSPLGFVELNDLNTQENIVNAIIHELTHFEQYLMLINTPDIGVKPYVKNHMMQGILKSSGTYRYGAEKRTVLNDEDIETLMTEDMQAILIQGQKQYENTFYHKARKIPHKKITKESAQYAEIKKIADSIAITYDHNNKGNTRFIYNKLFVEKMAFTVGNAAAVMFRNIIANKTNGNVSSLDKILDIAISKMY